MIIKIQLHHDDTDLTREKIIKCTLDNNGQIYGYVELVGMYLYQFSGTLNFRLHKTNLCRQTDMAAREGNWVRLAWFNL